MGDEVLEEYAAQLQLVFDHYAASSAAGEDKVFMHSGCTRAPANVASNQASCA